MLNYSKIFEDRKEMIRFVLECEENYSKQINAIADAVVAAGKIRIITLAGPTCSGKTTTSHILENEFAKRGITAKIVSIDDFYRERDDNAPKEEKPDYESIKSIDFCYFENCVGKILEHKEALLPLFDFVKQKRYEYIPYKQKDNEIIVFEGIQAMYPEIDAVLPDEMSKSIFINVEDDVNAYGNIFSKREIRFMRRLVRDFNFRNASPSRTLSLWGDVIENEDKNIIPNASKTNYKINSLLLYEINVIKHYILNHVKYNVDVQAEKDLFENFRKKFENIPQIPGDIVPENSMFREFIGKKE